MKKIDRFIGNKVKIRRKTLKISQYSLAYDLDISFQQLQKYESGENRIAASRLYEIAKLLNVSLEFFFEGLEGFLINTNQPKYLQSITAFDPLSKIKNKEVKNKLINFIIELEDELNK